MTEPVIDPETGKPKGNGEDPKPPDGFVSATDFSELKGRLDAFEKVYTTQPQQAPAPAAPSGPTVADQLREIEGKISAIDDQIDAAVKEGNPIGKLMRDRDALTKKQIRIEVKSEDIDPAFAAGVATIDQLSETVTSGQMPYLEIVRKEYDDVLKTIPAEQRMNPEMRLTAYKIAVGQNVDKIVAAEAEKNLREQEEPLAPAPGGNSRDPGNEGDTIPKPEEVLSSGAMKALRVKGFTPDQYYQSRGYDGWEDYYTKHKDYFEG